MTYYILAAAGIVILIALFVTYNSLVALRNKANEAYSTMDVFLQKRFDLIPNLVEVVKGYAKHEAETLETVTKMRSNANSDINEKVDSEMQISKALVQVFAVVEKYPQLLASNSFLDLQNQLKKVEEDISYSRRYYNGSVRELNNKCQMFPTNIIASMFGFKTMKMYEVASSKERENINVTL